MFVDFDNELTPVLAQKALLSLFLGVCSVEFKIIGSAPQKWEHL